MPTLNEALALGVLIFIISVSFGVALILLAGIVSWCDKRRWFDGYDMVYLSFTEECIMNIDYAGYIGGRIEVYYPNEGYDRYELRFLTRKTRAFERFRFWYDGKSVTWLGLHLVEWIVRRWFNDGF